MIIGGSPFDQAIMDVFLPPVRRSVVQCSGDEYLTIVVPLFDLILMRVVPPLDHLI
jgi:hypothetical protein